MTDDLKATLDPKRKSWIESANDAQCDFPIQNLPFGVFSSASNAKARVGVAIGDSVADLAVLHDAGLLRLPASAPQDVFARAALNDFIDLGRDVWRSVRVQLSSLLARDTATLRDDSALRQRAFTKLADAKLHLPVE
ncbi:MAG TPA: hypothetical protein VMF89_07060, partial [Polyangiales bacterium]|nr:hypothetical protein [Polyangiales bacterium]